MQLLENILQPHQKESEADQSWCPQVSSRSSCDQFPKEGASLGIPLWETTHFNRPSLSLENSAQKGVKRGDQNTKQVKKTTGKMIRIMHGAVKS